MTVLIIDNDTYSLAKLQCNYCENEAIEGSDDPFASEIGDDDLICHFVCSNLNCQDQYHEELYQYAMDV